MSVEAVQTEPAPVALEGKLTPEERRTILAVADDFVVSMETVCLPEDLDREVIKAHCEADALARMEVRPDIDLTISDQAMP